MAIRVYRNEAANAVNFEGASVEVFYNACLRAEVNPDDSNKIDIINDYRGDLSDPFYEFRGVPYTEFVDADGNPFDTAQEAIDYIHDACNVIGVGSVGTDLNGEVVNFRHDQTGTNLMNQLTSGWASIDEPLGAGERLVMDGTFLNDLVDAMPVDSELHIGLKDTGWANTLSSTGFEGPVSIYIRKEGVGTNGIKIRILSASSTSEIITSVADMVNFGAFIELTSSGNNIRAGLTYSGDGSSDDEASTAYADWGSARKYQTGDQGYGLTSVDVMVFGMAQISGNLAGMDTADVDWTGLSEVSVPTPAPTLATDWTKALDFSGGSERTQQVNGSYLYTPLKMGGVNNNCAAPATAGDTSNDSNARPWATSIVFSSDNNASNQHIWNLGEGAGSTDDNIYLRVDASRNLYFGWGRDGALNECPFGTLSSTAGTWYGVYIASNGTRLGDSHSASDIAAAFDIRMVNLQTGVAGSNLSTSSNWTAGSFGGRMNREFTGDMTIGGRGANRNFHGKVAGMVITTLRLNVAMPTDAEISMMTRDPIQWLTDYKVGNDFRRPSVATDDTNFQLNNFDESYGTQVWLMGDGTNDAYAQIRNQVYAAEQNRTPMNMISMVSSDIQNVSINGLS